MSSRSSGHAMYSWPSPMVYFPWGTPSNASRSASEMHCRHHCVNTPTSPDEKYNYSAGEINFHRKDTDIFRTGELVIDDGSGSWDGHRGDRRNSGRWVDGEDQWLPVGAYISVEVDGITLCSAKAPSVTVFEYSATPTPN